ncbi:beta-ketoacyl-[acyl-carrier-protein] synthase family protein [Lysobacter capsici]|uniref:beta-ketoacyl-[acyl-carrier-protein] synthase family protein n=1 Tax=Lysobacter capsici TaxID=435897 RepID=UPI0006277BCA|nr:beta-ketoacyl-[acyl-carrier-protein] synthase family protein [Lysobacter capsici]
MKRRQVAITGMGVLSPLGLSVSEVAGALRAGTTGIELITVPRLPSQHVAGTVKGTFSERFSYIERPFLDRCHEMAIIAAGDAIADAGLDTFESFGSRAGVYYGNVNGGMASLQNWFEESLLNGKHKSRPFTAMSIMANSGAAQVAIRHKIRGPVITHASACASSGVAIGEAMRAIADGYLDVAVTGGAEAPLSAALIAVFDGTRALSKPRVDDPGHSCRPFSKDRSGLVLGEGAAFLVLEAADLAERRGAKIHGYVRGYGVSCDAYHIGMPDSAGQIECLTTALRDAGIEAEDVGYVNAHATATEGGDVIEATAIREVFGDGPASAAVSSTKSVHGHLLGAASAMECLITVVAMNESLLPASGSIGVVDERCSLNHVGELPRTDCRIDLAVSFSCGFGGTNAALVLGTQRSLSV